MHLRAFGLWQQWTFWPCHLTKLKYDYISRIPLGEVQLCAPTPVAGITASTDLGFTYRSIENWLEETTVITEVETVEGGNTRTRRNKETQRQHKNKQRQRNKEGPVRDQWTANLQTSHWAFGLLIHRPIRRPWRVHRKETSKQRIGLSNPNRTKQDRTTSNMKKSICN